jgi:hypothetical protein
MRTGIRTERQPRYLRKWDHRFKRRWPIDDMNWYLLRMMVSRSTIKYANLVGEGMVEGAT